MDIDFDIDFDCSSWESFMEEEFPVDIKISEWNHRIVTYDPISQSRIARWKRYSADPRYPKSETNPDIILAPPQALHDIKWRKCAFEREPDRDVDNEVHDRMPGGGSHSYEPWDNDRFRDRPWSETVKDAVNCGKNLWELKNIQNWAVGAEKCLEAAESGSRVIQDLAKDAADLGKNIGESLIDSRTEAVKGGYADKSDLGFQ